jgi:hypothetical protein
MTEPTVAPPAPPAESASFWEDLIDIFYAPAKVFRRRANASPWPAFFFVSLGIAVISFFTFSAMQPIMDAEFARAAPAMMRRSPQITQEMLDRMKSYQETFGKYFLFLVFPVWVFLLGLGTWLVSKLFGAKQGFQASILIASLAFMPRLVGALIGTVQALLMDPSKLISQYSVSLSAARFYDPDKTNPMLLVVLGRLDLITIWVTVLLGIGVYVIGRVSKGQAAGFAVSMWVLGSLYYLRNAYLAS